MTEEPYNPPYTVTDGIIHLIARIGEQIGIAAVRSENAISPHMRKENQIRTIHSSLAIENNSLSLEQMTDVINGKRVLGAPGEILEVKNAFKAYNLLPALDPYSISDLFRAHSVLMRGLPDNPGVFRSGGVGVFAGQRLIHMAPPPNMVPELIENLFHWVRTADAHPLIKSCVFHYEFEFIHPFTDGNGRMGRMWQTLLLSRWKPLFAWLPVESIIKQRQEEYYKALAASDSAGSSTASMEFMLEAVHDALKEPPWTEQVRVQVTEQVERLIYALGNDTLTAREIMERLRLRHRPSFNKNYLRPALEFGLIEMTVPDKPNSSKQRYRAVKV